MIIIAVTCLLACLCVCGIQDLKSRKISNIWILSGVVSGLWFRGVWFFAGAALVLVLGYWLYYFRMMGAADLKVMALICGSLGIRAGFYAIAAGILLSAAGTLLYLGFYKKSGLVIDRLNYLIAWFRQVIQTRERIEYDRTGETGRQAGLPVTVPLGSYLSAGTMIYLLFSGWKGGR